MDHRARIIQALLSSADAIDPPKGAKLVASTEGEEWVRSRIQAMNPIREGMSEEDYQSKVNEFMAKSQIRELVQDISEMLSGKSVPVAALRRAMPDGSSWKATALSPKKDMGTRQVSQTRSSDIKMLKEDGQETTLDLGGAEVYQRGEAFFVSWPEMLNVVKYEPAEFSADKAQQAREDRELQRQEADRLRQEKQDAANKAAQAVEAALWDGFLVGLPNLKKGQAKKALDKLVRMNGRTAKTGDHIRDLVAQGYRVDGDRFRDKDRTSFFDKKVFGALPFMYAVFLAEKVRSGSIRAGIMLSAGVKYDPQNQAHRTELADKLKTRLGEAGFKLSEDRTRDPGRRYGSGYKGREEVFVFQHRKDPGLEVQVFTSIVTGGEVRSKGADAIRVCLVYKNKAKITNPESEDAKQYDLGSECRVHRTGDIDDIVERTVQRARDAYTRANQVDRCKKCGAPMAMSKAGKSYCSEVCWTKTDAAPVPGTPTIPAAPKAGGGATDAQVSYALHLVKQNKLTSPTEAEIRSMSKGDISDLISKLRAQRGGDAVRTGNGTFTGWKNS